MIRKLFVLLLAVANCSLIYAQTIKTDVLVIGRTPSGIAAAIQSARSKVKTVLAGSNENTTAGILSVHAGSDLPSGIWSEFCTKVHEFYKEKPSFDTDDNGSLKFEGTTEALILEKIADTVKNLNIYSNSLFTSIKKDGDRWEVRLKQNEKSMVIKARVLVDATENGEVATRLNTKAANGITNINYQTKAYRTSIASAANLSFIPLRDIVAKGADNIFVTEKIIPGEKNIQFLPMQLELGQGAGAAAAYCAFFKTTTKNLKVRIIQGEILDFKGGLLPFTDIPQHDRDWRAVQQVAATGMLKGVSPGGAVPQFLFRPDSVVVTSEVKPILTEIYTRAFLWFNREKPGDKFTVGNMLSLISDYTLTEPQVLKSTIQKAWKSQYKFKLDFDPGRPITRREFAVLANRFLNPFARTVDLEGRLVN